MNDWERLHRQAERYKQSYPPGTRVMLLNMNDPYSPVESGMRGTVQSVDDIGQLLMKWDNGRALSLIPGEDSFRRLTQEEIDRELQEQAQEQTISEQLFFKWGIEFDTEKYTVPDKGARKVSYTNKEIIENNMLEQYPDSYYPPSRSARRSASGGQALSQSNEPLFREPEQSVRTD